MKHLFTKPGSILFVIFAVLFLSGLVYAGKITGYVQDSNTGSGLPGANVVLLGTSIGTATDLDGNFVINSVPMGTYTIRVTFIGYQTAEKDILLRMNQDLEVNFNLEYGAVIEGKSVVITAQAEGQLEAINQQLSSPTIVNVVSSARIQELPDANAAESVGRLPGVAILRSGGEGEKVVIRGMSPQYNNITINGVKMTATGSGDRSTNLSMISSYMLDGIEVSKAAMPDQDGDVMGGTVNFKVKEANDGFHYDVITQGGYNELSQAFRDYKFVGSVSNRFLDNKLGIFAQVDIERRDRSSDELGARYILDNPREGEENIVTTSDLTLRDITREKQRLGGALVLDYRLPNGAINLTNFASRVNTGVINRSETYALAASEHRYVTTDSDYELDIMTNALTLKQDFNALHINALVSHSKSHNQMPRSVDMSFVERAAYTSVSDAEQANLEDIYLWAKNDLDYTYIGVMNSNFNDTKETDITGQLDLTYDINLASWLSGNIKAGGKYRHKTRSYNHDEIWAPVSWGGREQLRTAILEAFPWMQEIAPLGTYELPYEIFWDNDYTNDNYFDGKYEMGPVIDVDIMNGAMEAIEDLAWLHLTNNKKDDYDGFEDYSAAYLMTELNIGRMFTFIPGVRYERNRTEYTGILGDVTVGRGFDAFKYDDTTTVRLSEHLLPMFHLRAKPLDWFDVRLAYTKTLARPSYNHIIPSYTINTSSVNWKNYLLKPAVAENFDFYASFYQNHIGLLTAGVFYKEIDDLIFGTGTRAILDPAFYGLPPATVGQPVSYQVNNPNTVYVNGIELDWQTTFWYLPGALRGLVLNVNYTHTESEAKYPRTIIDTQYLTQPPWIQQVNVDTFYTSRLINQPDEIINLALGYDYKDFSMRVSMLYQSDIFKSNNFWPELRNSTDDYTRWDISIKQGLPVEGLMFYMNLNNITGAADINLNAGNAFPTSEQHYGMTIDAGLRLRM